MTDGLLIPCIGPLGYCYYTQASSQVNIKSLFFMQDSFLNRALFAEVFIKICDPSKNIYFKEIFGKNLSIG